MLQVQMWPQTPRQQKKSMTMAMQEAIVTVPYKGGGKDRGTCKSYRHVSVTPMAIQSDDEGGAA